MGILNLLGKRMIFFDGGTGTLLQEKGLQPGELPELWNITHQNALIEIHQSYFEAGSDIVLTNTFGGNRIKFYHKDATVSEIVTAAVHNAKQAAKTCNKTSECFIALDIGPTGKLLKPLGDLDFDDAYAAFAEMAAAGEKAGADLVVIETMSDIYETKAAVLAAKENTSLPVFATLAFDEKGKLLTGGDIPTAVAVLEGLGVDALGLNSGLGPKQVLALMDQISENCSIPVIIKPNAGLPRSVNGQTVFDVSPAEFAQDMGKIAEKGCWLMGGCCGTTPAHIAALYQACKDISPKPLQKKEHTVVSSYTHSVTIGNDPILIGERINPTGKSRFKQALRNSEMDYILQEGFRQQQNGAHILDVNVGLPEIDEKEMLICVMEELQSVIDLPLQLDTSNPSAMEAALRRYNGKAMINSVNGKQESMEAVFPLVKKYGGVVVGLTLDENGIPETAEGRLAIAKKIVATAASYGIDKKDVIIDVLAMTISSDSQSANETLKALSLVKEILGVKTSLGVSNISFGLPNREMINAHFYSLALQNGLNAAILNPNTPAMRDAYFSFRALRGLDLQCTDYIAYCSGATAEKQSTSSISEIDLSAAIQNGLKELAKEKALEMTATFPPLTIINDYLIPALDLVGKGFEDGTVFLPQLLMSAEAAKAAFSAIQGQLAKDGKTQEKKGKIILATVKGDIHDIGKNIVKVLLENYSYDVIDLGKDVEPELIAQRAQKEQIQLVGLSALMTTTVDSMAKTIAALRLAAPNCKVMVGGAVLTQEYADSIGADRYVRDAMASVHYAKEIFEE